eukprot:2310491-Pleurochrysis_carterae.AAC.1
MLACGVPWSANDYVIHSPIHDRSPCTKTLLNFEVGYPAKYRQVTPSGYLPTIGLLSGRSTDTYI